MPCLKYPPRGFMLSDVTPTRSRRAVRRERTVAIMSDRRSGIPMPRRASVAVACAAVAGVVVSLGGCAALGGAPASVALSETAGYPTDAPVAEPIADNSWRGEPVGWLAEDRATITIVSYGSSGCPFIATSIEVVDETSVAVSLQKRPAYACTDDLAPHTHVLAVPSGWGAGDGPYSATVARLGATYGSTEPALSTVELWPLPPEESIAVLVTRGLPVDVTLPVDSLEKGEPLAFWGPDRASLRVITWGSSSCPPPALSLDVVSASELALVFGALPPLACTADFAPTTHVLAVPAGLDAGTATIGITIEQRDAASLEYRIPITD